MNINLKFIQKAIEDRNYISFLYENKRYKNIKPLELIKKEEYLLKSPSKDFNFKLITNLIILKEKF